MSLIHWGGASVLPDTTTTLHFVSDKKKYVKFVAKAEINVDTDMRDAQQGILYLTTQKY